MLRNPDVSALVSWILNGMMDHLNVPANDSIADRLYAIHNNQLDFFALYDNDPIFRNSIQAIRTVFLKNGIAEFRTVVTPDNSPVNSPGRGGNNDGEGN